MLNEPEVGRALIAKDRFEALRPSPAACRCRARCGWESSTAWHAPGAGQAEGARWTGHHSAFASALFGGDGKARVFASGRRSRGPRRVALAFHEQLTFQEYIPGGDDRPLVVPRLSPTTTARCSRPSSGARSAPIPTLAGESAFIELAHDERLRSVGREVAAPLPAARRLQDGLQARPARRALAPAGDQRTLQPVALPRRAQRHQPAARRLRLSRRSQAAASPRITAPRCRWLSLQLDFRAYRELAGRGELDPRRVAALDRFVAATYTACSPGRDPAPSLRLWMAQTRRSGACHAHRCTRWRSTAS